jgi:hypothetical protein
MTSSNVNRARPSVHCSVAAPGRFARSGRHPLSGVLLGALALGCASEGVDLGGGLSTQALTGDSRCADSTVVEGNVRVTSREELQALEGCEEIRGDLSIQFHADADLTPLGALRVVESTLVIGSSAQDLLSSEDFDDPALLQSIEDREALLRGNWLTSLDGLESLERVGGLLVGGTGLVDLGPLAQLRRIGGGASEPSPTGFPPGELYLFDNPLLQDLTGLENVSGVLRLELVSNPALESLGALPLGPTLAVFNVLDVPALTDIDALASVKNIDILSLDGSGVTDLHAFSALESADSALYVMNNLALVDATGLGAIHQSQSILFSNNTALKTLPPFSGVNILPDLVMITDNPELEALRLDFAFATSAGLDVGGQYLPLSMGILQIDHNAQLSSVALAANFSESFGLHSVQIVSLEDNASLTRVDFGGLERADVLAIDQNAALSEVALGTLATVDSLRVTSNAALDASVFAPVRTFERVSSGNAVDLAP